MAVQVARHTITIEEFESIIEARAFGPDARVELIKGEIIDMSPIGEPHIMIR